MITIIGAGRIGTALRRRAEERGQAVTLLGRGQRLLGPAGEPVLVAVRADDLEVLIPQVPEHRRADLVFVQNGAIRELLAAHGLQHATRGVLYTMVARRGDDLLPGESSPFTGPHAERMVQHFAALGVPAAALDGETFARFELEKLLWLAILGLLCEDSGEPVGQAVDSRREDLVALVEELLPVGRAAWGVLIEPGWVVSRIVAYSQSIGSYRASVKEWRWRNGWLRQQAREHGLPTPRHDALLEKLGHG
jgi:ketopantoate reductase